MVSVEKAWGLVVYLLLVHQVRGVRRRAPRQPAARLAGRIPSEGEGQLRPTLRPYPQPGTSGSVWGSLVSCIHL